MRFYQPYSCEANMKWSRFNYTFKYKGDFFLYNSLSNSFAIIDKSIYASIKKGVEVTDTITIDDDLTDRLKRLKAIVEDDRDELLKVRYCSTYYRFDRSRLILTINPTLSCNFTCPYCFEKKHNTMFMTEEIEDSIIKYIKGQEQLKMIDVTWFGGEPLLAFSIIERLTKKIQSLSLEYKAGIITNGYLLTEKVINQLEDLQIKSIQITLDGTQQIHDSRRYLKNGKGSYTQILQNIELLKDKLPSINLAIRMNIDRENAKELIPLYDFFQRKDYPNTTFSPAFVENPTDSMDSTRLLTRREQVDFVKSLYKNFNIEFMRFYPRSWRDECAIRNPNSIVIGPEGELYKCWNDVGNKDRIYGYIDGRITNETLLLRYLGSADPFEDSKCKKCILLPVCGGGCPYYRIQNEFEGKNTDTCPLIKHKLKDFLLMHYQNKGSVKL